MVERDWQLVSDGVPLDTKLHTRLEGEKGENICFARMMWSNDTEIEWIDPKTGVTTVTHHSFAAPTHWAWIAEETP